MYFKLPNVSRQKQIPVLVGIIQKQRAELIPLRKETASFKTIIDKLEQEIKTWKERHKKIKEERDKFKKENEKLKQEIEKLTKTNSRYEVSLFDHGNFKSQKDPGNKKPKGGQLGHPDTNRENKEQFRGYETFGKKRAYAVNCGKCGQLLCRVGAVKQKALLDIVINPEIVKLIIESERQWCSNCKSEVNAKDPQTLPFSEYGINTFMMVMILRFKSHSSLCNISSVISIGFGLELSKSVVSNLLKSGANYLGSKYEELKQAVRKGDVIYADETGWSVKGHSAWMWIMATEDKIDWQGEEKGKVIEPGVTVYVPAESRGKGIAEEMYGNSQSFCMTDGYGGYTDTIPKEKHLYCWAHILRFAYEETVNADKGAMSVKLREGLVRIYHIKGNNPQYTKEQLEKVLREELNKLLALASEEESFLNIQNRISNQIEGLIKALLVTRSGTNNLAERELRPVAISRNISYGSDTFTGMKTTAIVASVIQTLSRKSNADVLTELTLALQIGIHKKYSQYTHLSYFDST